MLRTSLLFVFSSSLLFAQEISRITLIEDESSQSIPSYNYQGTIYVSLKHLADGLNVGSNESDAGGAVEIGDRMVVLAGQTIRGVALGVVVTALVQSILGGIGLAIVGVPFAGALTAIMFALCIAQLGPLIVLLGATAWVFTSLGAGCGGTFMLAWALVVGLMDNFLRPMLIKRGADLPLLLIFAGVIGGLVAFGIVGIFVGPVV